MRLFVADFGGLDLLVLLFLAPFLCYTEYESCNSAAHNRANAF
mgnify:FL=1